MDRRFIAVLLCVPCGAHSQQLFVEYEGTVSSIDRASLAEAPPYSIGDAIRGTLIIDTALAPADELGGNARIGRYYGGSRGLDFILGPVHEAGRSSGDLLLVRNDWQPTAGAPREDGLIIRDRSIGTDGNYDLLLGLQRPNLLGQLFANDSLAQSFEVESKSGTNLWGYIERGFGEFWRAVRFTLDRFSVAPRVCRAPT
jgi:hypothetical protein